MMIRNSVSCSLDPVLFTGRSPGNPSLAWHARHRLDSTTWWSAQVICGYVASGNHSQTWAPLVHFLVLENLIHAWWSTGVLSVFMNHSNVETERADADPRGCGGFGDLGGAYGWQSHWTPAEFRRMKLDQTTTYRKFMFKKQQRYTNPRLTLLAHALDWVLQPRLVQRPCFENVPATSFYYPNA